LSGFTDEDLDLIINYDIKYRMGQGDEAVSEAEATRMHPYGKEMYASVIE
jgi:hypothetical protein